MATVTLALHATKRLVKLTCAFTTSDVNSTIRAYRTIPGGGTTRLRLTRGAVAGWSSGYFEGVYTTIRDFPVAGISHTGSSYTGVVLLDPEPPQGVSPSYYIEVRNAAGTLVDSSSPVALSGAPDLGGDFLYDLSSIGRGITTVVNEFSELGVDVKSSVAPTLSGVSPIVGLDAPNFPQFNLELTTMTDVEARNMRGLLRYGGPTYALSPQTLSYGFDGPVYFAVTGYREQRLSKLGLPSERRWTLACQQVAAPAAYYGSEQALSGATLSSTWSTLYTGFAAETWSVVSGDGGHPAAYPVGSVS